MISINFKENDWVMNTGFPVGGLKTPTYGIVYEIKERREELLNPLVKYGAKLFFDFSDVPFGYDFPLAEMDAGFFVKITEDLIEELNNKYRDGLKKLQRMVENEKKYPWSS